MKKENGVLVFLIGAGIELCYFYACATFATTLFFHIPFPFPEAVGSFLLAAVLTKIADGRGWRVISVLAIQSIGYLPAVWQMIGVFSAWSDSFMANRALTDFFSNPADVIQYFVFVLVVSWTLVFWAGGVDFARRPMNYATIVSRFDRGLIAFFILFLTEFYLQAAQGISVDDSWSGALVIPFFIFSLLAIGLVRNQNSAERNFLPGFQTIGILLGFVVVVLLASAGSIFFFLPYLTFVAEKGNDVLGVVSRPLIASLFALTDWLFGSDFSSNTLPAPPEQSAASSVQWSFPWWVELIGRILGVGVVILVALVLLAIIGGLLYSIFLWLFSRTARDSEKPTLRNLLLSIRKQFGAWLQLLRRGNASRFKTTRLYAALTTWGRNSRVPRSSSETPLEYGARLQQRFPIFEKEFHAIIEAFNREVYGEIDLDLPQLQTARFASHKLASPVYWSMRLRAWFQNQN